MHGTRVEPQATPAPDGASHRIDSIDLLRGAVIVLMGLDHVRDFFSPYPFRPEDLAQAPAALFLTRWVTHFCAPVFVLLAGAGAWLYGSRGRTRRELASFLVTRGLFLVALELTLVNLSWLQFLFAGFLFVQVIWVIGWSMVLLAALLWVPRWALWTVTVATIAGHNLLDGVSPEGPTVLVWAWSLLHRLAYLPVTDGFGFVVIYPLIPWPAVMVLGYLLGYLFEEPAATRRRILVRLGAGMTFAFIALRTLDVYGDPNAWSDPGRGLLLTALAFLNTTKYPASLLFLLMTLGPALWALPALEHARGRVAVWLVTFGRVPLFFYLLHLPVIHLLAATWALAFHGEHGFIFTGNWPASYSPSLLRTYAVWIAVTVALYPPCRAYARWKRRSRSAVASYL